ncbi:type II toxin-antitoxin system PemK/MazF family toxin [Fusobacterium sp. SYSU M8A802]
MQCGEVWFANFPFEDDPSKSKKRPVIVLEDEGGEAKVLAIKVTSRVGERDNYDVTLLYWQKAKLRLASIARTSKYFYIDKSEFEFKIGDLHEDDLDLVKTKFMEFVLNEVE